MMIADNTEMRGQVKYRMDMICKMICVMCENPVMKNAGERHASGRGIRILALHPH
jgi:hypothetical protein